MFFWFSCSFFSPGLSKMLSECPCKLFRLFNEMKWFFFTSYWCSAKKSQPSCMFFLQIWQNCSLCVNWNFLRIQGSFKKNFMPGLRTTSEYFSFVLKQKSWKLSKMHSTCILKTFWGKYFFEKLILLLVCSDKEQKHFGLCRNYFSRDFASAFHC